MPVQFGGYILKTANAERIHYSPKRQPNPESVRKHVKDQFVSKTERLQTELLVQLSEEVAQERLDFNEAQLILEDALDAEKDRAKEHISPKDKRLIHHFDLQPTRDFLTELWLSAPSLKSAEQKERGAFARAILGKLNPGSTISEIKAALSNPVLLTEYRISTLTPENQSMVRHFSNSTTRKFLSEYSRDFPPFSPAHDNTEYGQFMREQLKTLPADTSIQDLKPAIARARFNYQLFDLPEHDQELITQFRHSSTQQFLLNFCSEYSDAPSSRQAAFGKNARRNLKQLPPNAPVEALEAAIKKARFEVKVSRLPENDQKLIARFTQPATREFVSQFCLEHSDFKPDHDQEFGEYVRHKLQNRHADMPVNALQDAMKQWEFQYEVSSLPKDDQKLIGMFTNPETQARVLDFCFDHSATFKPEHDQKFGEYVREKLAKSSPDLTASKLETDLELYQARWEKKGSRP